MSGSIFKNSFRLRSETLENPKRVATTPKPGRKAAITGAALLGLAAVTLAFYFVGHSRGMNFASSMRMGGMKLADWTRSLNFSKGQIVAAAAGTIGGVALIGAGVKYGPRAAKAAKTKVNILKEERATRRTERANRRSLRDETKRLRENEKQQAAFKNFGATAKGILEELDAEKKS